MVNVSDLPEILKFKDPKINKAISNYPKQLTVKMCLKCYQQITNVKKVKVRIKS